MGGSMRWRLGCLVSVLALFSGCADERAPDAAEGTVYLVAVGEDRLGIALRDAPEEVLALQFELAGDANWRLEAPRSPRSLDTVEARPLTPDRIRAFVGDTRGRSMGRDGVVVEFSVVRRANDVATRQTEFGLSHVQAATTGGKTVTLRVGGPLSWP